MPKIYYFVFILMFFSCQKATEKPIVVQKPQKDSTVIVGEEDKKMPEKAFLVDLNYKNFYKIWNEYSKTNVKDILCKLKKTIIKLK